MSVIVVTVLLSWSYVSAQVNVLTSRQPSINLQPEQLEGLFDKQQYEHEREFAIQTLGEVLDLPQRSWKKANKFSSNSTCASSLVTMLYDGIIKKTDYAKQMLDSWAKPESGMVELNIHWPGRYYECLSSEYLHNGSIGFSGKYCIAHFINNQTTNIFGYETSLTAGICVPSACSSTDLMELIGKASSVIHKKLPVMFTCPAAYQQWTSADSAAIAMIVLLLFLMFAGTISDLIPYTKMIFVSNSSIQAENSDSTALLDGGSATKADPLWKKAIGAFSLNATCSRILSTHKVDGNIHCLHGLRTLSILWVILGHTFLFQFSTWDNLKTFATYTSSHGEFMIVLNGFYSVDTFFFIGGFLVAYLGLKEMSKNNGRLKIWKMYILRYIRLTPAYAFCILFSISLYKYLGDGPNWTTVGVQLTHTCKKYWWTNLIYISNIYPIGTFAQCFAWGWYLACDMQYYLLSPLFLMLLYKKPRAGVSVVVLSIVISMILVGSLSTYYGLQPMSANFFTLTNAILGKYTPPPYNISGNATGSNADIVASDIYYTPWSRISVYLIGILTGYFIRNHNRPMLLNKMVVLLGWVLSTIVSFSLIFGNYHAYSKAQYVPKHVSDFYNAVSRPLWGLVIGWIVVACHYGYGGWVNRFLSWGAFIPLSRLTYCTYLVHPLWLYAIFGSHELNIHFTILGTVCYYLAATVLSFGASFILMVLLESPINGLQQIFSPKQPDFKTQYSDSSVNVPDNDVAQST